MKRVITCSLLVATLAVTGGCASQYSVNFNIHTDPEGSHVVYRQGQSKWIYLGVTPLDVIEVINKEQLEDSDTVSARVQWPGDQRRVERAGTDLLDPAPGQGATEVVFRRENGQRSGSSRWRRSGQQLQPETFAPER